MASKKTTAKKAAAPKQTYSVVLKTPGKQITAKVQDRVLYPMAVTWNRLLSADQGRQKDKEEEKQSWRKTGKIVILDLARAGEVSDGDAQEFIAAAAASGIVQVEMEWQREGSGYAARVFPWEALIALATKDQREASNEQDMVVVRYLKGGPALAPATGPAGFAVSAGAVKAGFDTTTERAAIEAALRGKVVVKDLRAKSLSQLQESITAIHPPPSIIHYVISSAEEIPGAPGARDLENIEGSLEAIARTVAAHGPELVSFSTCHSGRRLAPLAISLGARLAIGFHGWVMDASCPPFFGAFYRAWKQNGRTPLAALREALAANRHQPDPDGLGVVTLWSAYDLLAPGVLAKGIKEPAGKGKAERKGTGDGGTVTAAQLVASLHFTCTLQKALSYSMLHNKSGGLFATFVATKLAAGKMDDLEVTVKIDTGFERPVESHFFAPLREAANSVVDLAPQVMVPLGSELLRRRGEMILGTVEIAIRCGNIQVFHRFDSIELPPCDEWEDNDAGRRYLPSFIFPRDPAVRDILSASQPFLRALTDDVIAGFDGYQQSFAGSSIEAVRSQLRAIWVTLQTTHRLDYVNPPPTYTRGKQRLRTPEEVLRGRRGTCIELALLLAACWEHIGIYPVIFLTPGHAFTGYWTSTDAWTRFFAEILERATSGASSTEGIKDDDAITDQRQFNATTMVGGGTLTKDEAWVLKGPHHLAMIHREVLAKNLIAVEATAVALQKPFGLGEQEGRDMLLSVRHIDDFDGMIDCQKAREKNVTPLAILTQNVVA